MSDWPRLTKPQRLMLLDMERNHGAIQHTPRQRQTAYALAWHGMVKTFGPFSGIELTQRGRDYLRFGLKRGQSGAGARDVALEEAAKIAESFDGIPPMTIAARIRELKSVAEMRGAKR